MSLLHVTDILRISGARKPLPMSDEDKEWYFARGKMIHRETELFDTAEHGLDWGLVDESIRPFVEGYALFRKEMKGKLIACECRIENSMLGYCGTIDRVFADLGGVRGTYIVDLKTNDWDTATKWQVAAYAKLWARQNGLLKLPYIRALALKDDGTYRLGPKPGDKWDTRICWSEFLFAKTWAQMLLANGLAKQEERE